MFGLKLVAVDPVLGVAGLSPVVVRLQRGVAVWPFLLVRGLRRRHWEKVAVHLFWAEQHEVVVFLVLLALEASYLEAWLELQDSISLILPHQHRRL